MKSKQKTNKSVKKRVKVTATGKVKRRKAGTGHLLSVKTSKRRRDLRKPTTCTKADAKRIRELINE